MRLGDLAQGQHRATAGIGEQHIEVAVGLLDAGIQRIQLLKAGGVHCHTGGVAHQFHRLVQLGLAPASDVHVGALFGETLGGGQADAGGAAGNQCDLAFKFLAHGVSPVWGSDWVWEKRIDLGLLSK